MSIVQPVLLLALCAPFVLAIWIALTHRRRAVPRTDTAPHRIAETKALDPTRARFEAETVDVEAAVREAAATMEAEAGVDWVRIDLAVRPAPKVHVDPGTLRMALRETMLSAIRASPGGQVLVTTVTLGSQLHIRITDDVPGNDQRGREVSTREAGALIGLQGGSIAVEARPGQGTTVTMRLPLPGNLGGEVNSSQQLPVLANQAA